jgi:hypothetical protein
MLARFAGCLAGSLDALQDGWLSDRRDGCLLRWLVGWLFCRLSAWLTGWLSGRACGLAVCLGLPSS